MPGAAISDDSNLIEAMTLGAAGGVIGALIGAAAAAIIAWEAAWPVLISPWALFLEHVLAE